MRDATDKASAADAKSVDYWKERARVNFAEAMTDIQAERAAERETAAVKPAVTKTVRSHGIRF
jgi:hypothetical protein